MNFQTNVACLLLFTTLSSNSNATCEEVYASSVVNVDKSDEILTRSERVFHGYCENSGSLKQQHIGFNFSIPLGELLIPLEATAAENENKMKTFCSTYKNNTVLTTESYLYSSRVVNEALASFNQCKRLEAKQIDVTHTPTTDSVTVDVRFNPSNNKVSVNSIGYSGATGKCRTTSTSSDKKSLIIPPDGMKSWSPSSGFSIICKRESTNTKGGLKKYDRFSFIMSLNAETYAFELPVEGLAGYDLALRHKQNFDSVVASRDHVQKELAQSNRLLEKTASIIHLAVQGEQHIGRPVWAEHVGCNTNIQGYANNVCGVLKSQVTHAWTHGGNRCGYNYYVISCFTH